ncbi:GDSL esterase/lipase At5g03610-like [Telopea speciosissima]|uniref:GDSL esterase/lipase At5g03610-like n=1 Tax=Telopea speciosissima TaxID=54955 RepID=UPI001CC800FB|nr:GDSL esterase/lipase At5g03610-like [Telopea speciosissima]
MANISSSSSTSAASVAERFSWYCALFLLVLLLLDCSDPDESELPIQMHQITERVNYNNKKKVCDEIYVVEKGETLHTISEKCGDPFIVEKNPHIHDPDDVFPGFVIKITPNVSLSGGVIGGSLASLLYTASQHYYRFKFSLVIGIQGVESSSNHQQQHLQKSNNGDLHRLTLSKLFVFGDSYTDTGNIRKSVSSSWKLPYGITFPGKPTGRFSDGRVLTDYVASFMGIKSPIPYRRRMMKRKSVRYGVNFAWGGTGVFKTLVSAPNMTTQIRLFQRLIHHDRLYTQDDLASSLALVSLAGNDYGAYNARNGSAQGLRGFIASVVKQLALNLKRIHDMGVKKIAVTALEPLGCLPQNTVKFSYQKCNGSLNMAVNFHNLLLQQAVAKLNNETKDSAFHILNLYDAFMSTFKRHGNHSGGSILKPCCVGMKQEFSCGSVDETGKKQYRLCQNPHSAFFWDDVHPSQAGWHTVYAALQASLFQLYP